MIPYTDESPVFSDSIQITETSDKAHADIINAAPKQLLANTLFLKNQAGIPQTYDQEGTYNIGDIVTYEGTIYKCKEKIEGGEVWNPEHWEAVSTMGEIEKILAQAGRIETGVDLLVRNLVPLDKPVYGMIIHEQTDQVPTSRVEYIGANKGFKPMKMNMDTHVMDLGGWADWDWLKGVVPVMCDWDGGIDYYLDPDDYTKKVDGETESDVDDVEYPGNAMVVIPLIYTCEYKRGTDRVVLFCERKLTDDFEPIGFNVKGIVRNYMLIPMFYGSIDSEGRMRSISGQWSFGTASGAQTDLNAEDAFVTALSVSVGITTDIQYNAIQKTSKSGLFFGGPLTNTLADICVMLSGSTNSQEAFGGGMSHSNVAGNYLTEAAGTKDNHYNTLANAVVNGGMFYGSSDNKSFNKIFHSCVLGSMMLWQRDPYMVSTNGRIKVSVDYTYDPTGAQYLDTGIDFKPGDTSVHYYTSYHVVKGFGPVPDAAGKDKGTSATGYCDGTWANAGIIAVSLRFGACPDGLLAGLWARTLDH